MTRLFGTDGVRGVANKDLTPEMAYRLGVAGAMVLASEAVGKTRVLIGSDTRISCGMLENALVSGICSAGADAYVCNVIPTPAVAYLTKKYKCDAGVMISASHNSFEYNGIKFFSGSGFKLPDDTEDEIEAIVKDFDEKRRVRPTGDQVGKRIVLPEAAHEYTEHLKRRLSVDITGLRIALDCANGAASAIAPQIFRDLGAQVIVTGDKPDGMNINHNCGSTHMKSLSETVIGNACDLGLAFDGDADRMLAMDAYGHLVDGDVIMAMIAQDMRDAGELKSDTLVVTVMSNLGLDIMAEKSGLKLEKAKVGDRYVLERMLAGGFNLGGEQSGHIILLDHATTGDGILSALALLRVLVRKKQSLSQLAKIVKVLPQILLPVRLPEDKKSKATDDPEVGELVGKLEKELGKKGRILVRASGTEPVIRVMLEGEDLAQIKQMAEQISDLISLKFGA